MTDSAEQTLREEIEKKDRIIRNLSLALREAIQWWLVEGKQPPYQVPYAMDGDLWKQTEESDKAKAIQLFSYAIERMAHAPVFGGIKEPQWVQKTRERKTE